MLSSLSALPVRPGLLGAVAASLLGGCNRETAPNPVASETNNSGAPGAKRYKIGFANLTEDVPFAVRVREGIEADEFSLNTILFASSRLLTIPCN